MSNNNFKNVVPILLMVAMYFALQWLFPQKQAPKGPPPVTATAAALPAGLKLETADAQAAFQTALGELNAGARSAVPERDKHYNDAIKALQQFVKSGSKESPDAVAAQFEEAYIQWHDLDNQREGAASTLNNIRLLRIPGTEMAPVFNGHAWVMQPALSYAERMYLSVAHDINTVNSRKFGYQFIHFFVQVCSFIGRDYRDALALIVLGTLVTILLTPVRNWQYKSMSKMGVLQPHMKKIQQDYKGQPEEINRRTAELYKEHGTNPLMGCLPMLVQMPFMWWLYYAIRLYQFQFNGKFLWIGSGFAISHVGWSTPNGPVFATSLAHMDIPLLTLYAISMYFYSKFMPQTSADPEQARQSQKMSAITSLMMPVMFYFYGWPSAFILWWLAMNVTQTLVTVLYLRHHPDLKAMFSPPAAATSAASPAVIKTTPVKVNPTNGKQARPAAGTDASSGGRPAPSGTEAGPRRIEPKNRRKPRGGRRF